MTVAEGQQQIRKWLAARAAAETEGGPS